MRGRDKVMDYHGYALCYPLKASIEEWNAYKVATNFSNSVSS